MTAWNASDITSDDVAFVSENQLSDTPAQNRQFVFELLKTGLLADEDGKISDRMRTKLLDIVGFGMREAGKDVESLQIKRARGNAGSEGAYARSQTLRRSRRTRRGTYEIFAWRRLRTRRCA